MLNSLSVTEIEFEAQMNRVMDTVLKAVTKLENVPSGWGGIMLSFDVVAYVPHNHVIDALARKVFPRLCGGCLSRARWMEVDHQLSHAVLGFCDSPFNRALGVSTDGGGNDGNKKVYLAVRLESGVTTFEELFSDLVGGGLGDVRVRLFS